MCFSFKIHKVKKQEGKKGHLTIGFIKKKKEKNIYIYMRIPHRCIIKMNGHAAVAAAPRHQRCITW